MRLAEFIRKNREAIVSEWEEFARTRLPVAAEMTPSQLRDHAVELIQAAATDLEAEQSSDEQKEKSRGEGSARRMRQVARNHAMDRMRSGFRLDQVLAEYRALRASVIRLWEAGSPDGADGDLTRFNEAIDEALTESVNGLADKLQEYRDQFLAILGHDLRNPLSAIEMSAQFLSRSEGLDEKHAKAAWRIVSAAGRMKGMVSDLLDLTRTRLGQGISISKGPTNLGAICKRVVDELEAFHPDRQLSLACEGDLNGEWDENRMAQVVSNLVGNALQHGDEAGPVTVRAVSENHSVLLTVHNFGPTIPKASLKAIFDPMVRSSTGEDYAGQSRSLGLGLFIVQQVVDAHAGSVDVASTDEGGTTFTVSLPRSS
jgi:signal transduction histidine kinase